MLEMQIAFIISTTLIYSTAYIYAAMGAAVNENAGVVNIGLEGMMYFGAFFGAAVSFWSGSAWIGFFAAGISGMTLGLLHAFVSISMKMDDILSGVAINLLGPGFALFFCRYFFNGNVQTPILDVGEKIPRVLAGIFEPGSILDTLLNHYASVYIALALVACVWFILYKTRFGFRIRSVGENPKAAQTAGISAVKTRYYAVLISGFLAGLGGASISIALVSRFTPTLISGHGFMGLAALIFGRWTPQGALLGCLLFGFSQAIVISLPSMGIDVSSFSNLLSMLPFVITIFVLVVFVRRAVAPAAIGQKI